MNRIENGDCVQIMEGLKKETVDLIITDPPYNLSVFMNSRDTNLSKMRKNFFGASGWDDMEYDDWFNHMDEFFKQSYRLLKKGGSMIVFMSIIKVESIIALASKYGFYYKTTGIWHKTNPMPRNMNLHFVNSNECWIYLIKDKRTGTFNNTSLELDFIETSVTPASEKKFGKHPTQKPVKLMEHFIGLLSNEGDLILDPFLGSGSSIVAAKRLGRNYIGIELDENYCEIARKRVENE